MLKKRILIFAMVAVMAVTVFSPCAIAASDATNPQTPNDTPVDVVLETEDIPATEEPISDDSEAADPSAPTTDADAATDAEMPDNENASAPEEDSGSTTETAPAQAEMVEVENPNAARNRYLLVGGICIGICVALYVAVRIKANGKK